MFFRRDSEKVREKRGEKTIKSSSENAREIAGFNDGGGQIYRRGFIWTGCSWRGVRFALVIYLI